MRRRRLLKTVLLWPLLLLPPALSLPAENRQGKELSLILGRGELLSFPDEVQRVAISEPKIADAVVVSPREIMVNAKGVGKGTVVVWETNGAHTHFSVDVVSDTSELESLRQRVAASLPQSSITLTGNAETLVLTGSAASADESKQAEALATTHARKVVNLLKTPDPAEPRQILLQVKFASVDRVGLSELGFNLFSRNEKMLGGVSTQQFSAPRFSQLQFENQTFANTSLNFSDLLNIFVFRPDLNIGATIKALQGRQLLQILAEPNLVVVEGQEGSFLAGGEFPYPTIQATPTGGATAPVVTVRFKSFGVQLFFTPTITAQGSIRLKVAPEVSALDFANAVSLQGFLIPAVSTRRAETEVILKDGESFAIAGLIDNRVVQNLNRISGLGDIPILGHLFRSRSTKKSTDELLVVVTPRFVRPLAPDEAVKMLEMPEAFLPGPAEEKAGGEARQKKKEEAKTLKQPEFVGPRGHQESK